MCAQKNPNLTAQIGDVELPNPIMSASGTGGFGVELSPYMDLSVPGAITAKSLAIYSHSGNSYPRVSFAPAGMLNSVGLQGPGISSWLENYFPKLKEAGARIVVSIWGKNVEEFEQAAQMLVPVKSDITALELNVSCPNLEDGSKVFSHSGEATAEVISATSIGLPQWAKLAPDTPNLCEVATQAKKAGCAAVTLVNSLPAMRIDADSKKPYLSGVTGGLSGNALKPIALKAVYESYKANPDLPIIGVGGVSSGEDVAEFLMAGASAVQVGTALFLNPRALIRILNDFKKWCRKNEITKLSQIKGIAHK